MEYECQESGADRCAVRGEPHLGCAGVGTLGVVQNSATGDLAARWRWVSSDVEDPKTGSDDHCHRRRSCTLQPELLHRDELRIPRLLLSAPSLRYADPFTSIPSMLSPSSQSSRL